MKWSDLEAPPEVLDRTERWIVGVAAVVAAASRLLSLAHTPWDWDEMLFSLGVRRYDVTFHHPHPPGFPLYILAAKAVTLLGATDFRALQSLSIAAGLLLFPAAFFLCREMRFDFMTSMFGALFLAFLPNVWFYGGAALSDVPSLTLVVLACALLLRGARSQRSFLLGALVLAAAVGVRPQNLLVGACPALVAIVFQFRRDRTSAVRIAAVAALIFIAVDGAAYAYAIHRSGGWAAYHAAVEEHQQYIMQVDSFLNPHRRPLVRLIGTFFVHPFEAPAINYPLGFFILIALAFALVRRHLPAFLTVATFAPFACLAWLVLDVFSASRFSIGYAPLPAFLAADGMVMLYRGGRESRAGTAVAAIAGAAIVAIMGWWTLPALAFVRRHETPPYAAVMWVRQHLDPRTTVLRVHGSMLPYCDYFLADYRRIRVDDDPSASRVAGENEYFIVEALSRVRDSVNFVWPESRLWDLVRQRYFVASVSPMSQNVVYGSGWYLGESAGEELHWRWMGHRSVTYMAPLRRKEAVLSIRFHVPVPNLPRRPTVRITFNGVPLESFVADRTEVERSYIVQPRSERRNELVIETDGVVNLKASGRGNDSRDLGLRLDGIGWSPGRM